MLQLTQKLQSGEMVVQEVPAPVVGPGTVLVRNHYSLISPGTEGSTVRAARKSLIGKAKERPHQVKRVLEGLRTQGPVQTYRAVAKKLGAYSPLGYSSAGELIELGSAVTGTCVGDLVACAGAGYANHAEIIAVPVNLTVRLTPDADLSLACYNTLGAIAMQGVRQADLRLGESCAVIGLGLLGQLTCLLLRAAGIHTYGLDTDPSAVAMATEHCVDAAWVGADSVIAGQLCELTCGLGVDAVIITAATDSLGPINFAGEIARQKGRVVVVGAVPTGFDRDPHYYRKELELRMSCSYGPGRYSPGYEEKGLDYPAAYVRWTEQRNMQAFQELIRTKRIDIGYLTTHTFPFNRAPEAYDLIVSRREPCLGVVLRYDAKKPVSRQRIDVAASGKAGSVGIAFIGAGSYAQSNLLPNIPFGDPGVRAEGVMTSTGTTSKRVAEKYGFAFCASADDDIIGNERINTVFIATRHDTHADYALRALRAGQHVFVEKPLCLNKDQLSEFLGLYRRGVQRSVDALAPAPGAPLLMVGFNRRFSPLARLLKENLGPGPVAMVYRVNAGAIPRDAWIQDPEVGGGRIVGEVCHFVDFLTYLCESLPTLVSATSMADAQGLHDTLAVNLQFENGSIGSIAYFANGAKSVPKEHCEVYQSGLTGIISDFKAVEVHRGGRPMRKKLLSQDKGQRDMVRSFLGAVKAGDPSPTPFAEVYAVTMATFKIRESLRTGTTVRIDAVG